MNTSTQCESREASPDTTFLLQPVLGTDKRNPVFSVYRQNGPTAFLHVYYGAELLEVVPDDREHPTFKLLIGRLYNAGVSARGLQQRFGMDRKTMQRWGRALQSDDSQELVRALAGRGGHRKLTPEIRAFVATRFLHLYPQTRRGYSQAIRREIQEIFGVQVSGECLRALFKELKAQLREEMDEPGPNNPVQSRETACDEPEQPAALNAAEIPSPSLPEVPTPMAPTQPEPPSIRNQSPVSSAPQAPEFEAGFCHHLGVLLFSSVLIKLQEHGQDQGWLFKQWLATLLLGAVNIEQTKLLDFEDLRRLLGRTLRSLFPQRTQLSELAARQSVDPLLRFNAELVEVAQVQDFYFDPHTKHYTGMQNVLKGWCPRIRWADKVLHSDFVHTAAGDPVYLECVDNYQDMRERFEGLLPRFRHVVEIPENKVITWVIDRGIFSQQVFKKAIEAPDYHLITWEKNYRGGQWDESRRSGQYLLERTRNHAQDKRAYHFEYIDQSWAKNPRMRQLIVRATNPQGRSVEVGILTDDRQRPAPQIVHLIFNRWIQENDFKYLDEHFGINEITSYALVAYERLKAQLEEKQIKSGAYKALEKELSQIKNQLGKLLVAEHQHPGKSTLRTNRIAQRTEELSQVQARKDQTEKEVSRLEVLIQQQMVRLDTRNKRLMDSLKIIARNAFYRALAPFKNAYNNYRDDHEFFRNLTQADGLLRESAEEVHAYLMPTVNYPPKMEKIVGDLLAQINASDPRMPDGSGRRLRFDLAPKSGIQVAIQI